ncbi:MAG: malate dehydrogenase [Thermodesulfovibrionales bacterium]|nr:malate dehydrogenase [Thermodesulfovibrionales bacterium]
MRKKVSIIGAGNVGASLAQLIAHSGLADVMLFDIAESMPQGKALDISEACPLWGSSSFVRGTNDYQDTECSDVIVITAGFPRRPGMSRDDLLYANAEVVRESASRVVGVSPNAVIIVVTNPMDVMTQLAWQASGFPTRRVIGMGGVLDSARLRTFVAWELGVSPADVEAMVLGGHGDEMLPLPRFTTVKGVPIATLLDSTRVEGLIGRARNGGAEIVGLLKHGSACYAPAAAAFQMAKAVLLDEKRLLPCSAYLDGQYGIIGLYAGVPVIIGKEGVERIVELKLDEAEMKALEKSARSIKALIEKLEGR